MEADREEWRKFMDEIRGPVLSPKGSGLPDPLVWREDIGNLAKLTGLRRTDFNYDDAGYVETAANIICPPMLPDNVAPIPAHFVKPSLVDDVIAQLLQTRPRDSPGRVAVTGMGGAGKSTIAAQVVRNKALRRRFSDGVLWMQLTSIKKRRLSETKRLLELKILAKQFQELVLSRRFKQGRIVQCNTADWDFKSLPAALSYFKSKCEEGDLECLLVVDNAWDEELLKVLDETGFHILATTRNKDALPAGPRWCSLSAPLMTREASLTILQICSGACNPVPRIPALQVAEDCGFLPLMLAIAGAHDDVMDNPSSDKAWRKLHNTLKDKAEMQRQDGEDLQPISPVLSASFDALGQEQRNHFLRLAVLPHGLMVLDDLLCNLWEKADPIDAKAVAKGLERKSLLQVVGQGYHMHDVLLDFAKVTIEGFRNIKAIATQRQAQYLGRLKALRACVENGATGPPFYLLLSLWRSLEELSGDNQLEVRTYTSSLKEIEGSETGDAAVTYFNAGILFAFQGKCLEAENCYTMAQNIWKGLPGDDANVAAALNNRAIMKDSMGKHTEAEKLREESHAIRMKFGPEHSDYASALNNKGLALKKQGKYAEAAEAFDQAWGFFKNTSDQKTKAKVLANRDSLAFEMGDYAEAEAGILQALSVRQELLGPDHEDVASSLSDLAALYDAQGDFSEANTLFARAHKIWEKEAPGHDNMANNLNSWGNSLREQSNYDEAESRLDQALTILEETWGPKHIAIGMVLINQACLLTAQEKYDEAMALCWRAFEIYEEILGPHDQAVAGSLHQMVNVLMDQDRVQKKFDEAIPLNDRALEIREKVFGPESLEVAPSLNWRARLLLHQRKPDEALAVQLRCVAIEEKVLPKGSGRLANSLRNLAVVRTKQVEHTEAKARFEHSEATGKSAGPGHSVCANSLNKKAADLLQEGKRAEATEALEQAWNTCKNSADNAHNAQALSNWASLHFDMGDCAKAKLGFEEALRIRVKLLGRKHLDVAGTLSSLGLVLSQQGKPKEAVDLMVESLAIQEEVLPASHPSVAASLCNLGGFFTEQERFSEADPLFARANSIWEKQTGPRHDYMANNLSNWGMSLTKQGKYDEAGVRLHQALEIWEENRGPNHISLATGLVNQARLLIDQGEYEEAMLRCTRSLLIQEDTFDREHPAVVGSLDLMVETLTKQNKLVEALTVQLRCVSIQENNLPDDDSRLAASRSMVTALCEKQGTSEEVAPIG